MAEQDKNTKVKHIVLDVHREAMDMFQMMVDSLREIKDDKDVHLILIKSTPQSNKVEVYGPLSEQASADILAIAAIAYRDKLDAEKTAKGTKH